MNRKYDDDELQAHLARYGIPLPEDATAGRPRHNVGRKMEKISRRFNESEQEARFRQAKKRFG